MATVSDIRINANLMQHKKTRRLQREIGACAIAYLIQLWTCVANQNPNGVLEGWDELDIEDACRWDGKPGKLVKTLIDLRWIDRTENGFAIHNWKKHQPWVCGAEERSERARRAALARWRKRDLLKSDGSEIQKTEKSTTYAESMQGACESHAGSNAPFPSLPSPTQDYPSPPLYSPPLPGLEPDPSASKCADAAHLQPAPSASSPSSSTKTSPPAKKKTSRSTAKRKCAIPETFALTKDMRAWAMKNAPGLDIDQELLQFCDYHKSRGSLMKDWKAAWRTWMRNAVKFNKARKPYRRSASDQTTAEIASIFSDVLTDLEICNV